jgi:hypothetical protein
MWISIELANDNGGETFIGLSSGACDGVQVRSPPLYLVDPEVQLRSRQCILPIMLSETFDDLDPWHAFNGEEFDELALFNFHDLDTLCPMNPLLLAKGSRRPISTVGLCIHTNRGCTDHFHVMHFVNGQPRKESPGQYRRPCIPKK